MKFIFPQNYNISTKLLGLFDYSTAILNAVWYIIIIIISNIIFCTLKSRLIFFIITCFPLFLFSIIGFNHENIVYVFLYLLKFISRPKIYVYKKF